MPRLISNESLFTTKLQEILQNESMKQILSWGENKHTIEIYDKNALLQQILPKYFRHNRFQSFIRQMNLYGFKKIRTSGKHSFINTDLKNGKRLTELKSKNQLKRQNYTQKEHENNAKLQQISEFQENNIENNSIKNKQQQIKQIINVSQANYQPYNVTIFNPHDQRLFYSNYYHQPSTFYGQNHYNPYSFPYFFQSPI